MAESVERRRVLAYGATTGVVALVGLAGSLAGGLESRSAVQVTESLAGSVPAGGAQGAVPLSQGVASPPYEAFDLTPARQALHRLLPAHADQIELAAVDFALADTADPAGPVDPADAADRADPVDRTDRYRITAPSGSTRTSAVSVSVSISGTSTSALLAGVGWYLKHVAGVTISLPGDSLAQLPARLPAPAAPIVGAAAVRHRFALNDTENGYAGAYRTWADWERLLDVLALHGFNEVLIAAGHDEVYRRVFAEFGYSPEELDAWIPAPAYQPWWLLANLSSVGGPVSGDVRQAGVDLVRRIVARLRELGLVPVLPGYAGQVPDGFAGRNPGASVIAQGDWNGYQRPDWLDPRDPCYARVADSFYKHQDEVYGRSTAYKMDLLHEGGQTGGVPLGDAAVAVMAALQTARPGATWVILGWQDNPRRDVLDALRACGPAVCAAGQVLVVDGCSDEAIEPDREADWGGTAYAFGAIPNFGGRSLLGGNASTWTARFPKALVGTAGAAGATRATGTAGSPGKGSSLSGIAWMPEASGHDPAAFELFAELAWRPDPVDLGDWFDRYAARRYGRRDDAAANAWRTFSQTAYSLEPGKFPEGHDSLFCAWPDFSATSAAPGGPVMRYDAAAFQDAVRMLLRADPALRAADAYRYDVVDFTRQALANHARVLLPDIKNAYIAKDLDSYRHLTGRWLDAMNLLDGLLATDERFLLGTWLRSGGWDARSLITTWGGRKPALSLHNYGARELSGLVADVYLPRWRKHFADHEDVVTGAVCDLPAADWYAFDDAWAHTANSYPDTPTGDPFAAANDIAVFLAAS
ncbi:MAG: alpha-N-acetylglucosaminidase [Catenulispora sp.]|nr:alpha-N-acetylglucosaminidase [Catenulispora sp.]